MRVVFCLQFLCLWKQFPVPTRGVLNHWPQPHAGGNIFFVVFYSSKMPSITTQEGHAEWSYGTTSQPSVFKSNFQFSRADCSAARLPEKKKKNKIRNFALCVFCFFIFVSFSLRYASLHSPWGAMPVYDMIKVSVCVYSLNFVWTYRIASYLSCSIAVT